MKFSIGICILNVEYFNAIANNTIQNNNLYENLFIFIIKFRVKIYFCHCFWLNSKNFCMAISVSICYKIVLKKYVQTLYIIISITNDALTRLCICNTDIFANDLYNT